MLVNVNPIYTLPCLCLISNYLEIRILFESVLFPNSGEKENVYSNMVDLVIEAKDKNYIIKDLGNISFTDLTKIIEHKNSPGIMAYKQE